MSEHLLDLVTRMDLLWARRRDGQFCEEIGIDWPRVSQTISEMYAFIDEDSEFNFLEKEFIHKVNMGDFNADDDGG